MLLTPVLVAKFSLVCIIGIFYLSIIADAQGMYLDALDPLKIISIDLVPNGPRGPFSLLKESTFSWLNCSDLIFWF